MKASNIAKSWMTTALGTIIMLSAIVSIFITETTWTEASIGVGLGFVLWLAPDSLLKRLTGKVEEDGVK